MAKIIHTNPHLNTAAKQKAAVIKSVISSSRIEGVYLTEAQITETPSRNGSKSKDRGRAADKAAKYASRPLSISNRVGKAPGGNMAPPAQQPTTNNQ